MICEKCGKEYQEEFKFCPYCGKKRKSNWKKPHGEIKTYNALIAYSDEQLTKVFCSVDVHNAKSIRDKLYECAEKCEVYEIVVEYINECTNTFHVVELQKREAVLTGRKIRSFPIKDSENNLKIYTRKTGFSPYMLQWIDRVVFRTECEANAAIKNAEVNLEYGRGQMDKDCC